MPNPNAYEEGDLVTVTALWKVSGAVADPTTVTLQFRDGSGPKTVWVYGGAGSIVRDSMGAYHADLNTTGRAGLWVYEWNGLGAANKSQSGSFSVSPGI